MQQELNCISNRCDQNYMQLNPKKFKELRVNFRPGFPELRQLTIDKTTLETVSRHKLLGCQFENYSKWNKHVDFIATKAARRLCSIRTLKRSGVPEDDLISIYTSLIRSIMDYGYAVLYGIHACLLSLLIILDAYKSDFFALYSHIYLTVKL